MTLLSFWSGRGLSADKESRFTAVLQKADELVGLVESIPVSTAAQQKLTRESILRVRQAMMLVNGVFVLEDKMKKKLYLAGPINGRCDADCNEWRSWAKANWPGDTLDPMRRDYRGREDEAVAEIVEGDKADIREADSFVAFVELGRYSVGTTMEILYAWEQGKPVAIALAPSAEQPRISPWLHYHSHFIGSLAECLTFLGTR